MFVACSGGLRPYFSEDLVRGPPFQAPPPPPPGIAVGLRGTGRLLAPGARYGPRAAIGADNLAGCLVDARHAAAARHGIGFPPGRGVVGAGRRALARVGRHLPAAELALDPQTDPRRLAVLPPALA